MICKDKLSDQCHNRDMTYSWYLISQKVHILAKIKNCVFPVSFWKRKKSYTGKKIYMLCENGFGARLHSIPENFFYKKRVFTEIRPYSE